MYYRNRWIYFGRNLKSFSANSLFVSLRVCSWVYVFSACINNKYYSCSFKILNVFIILDRQTIIFLKEKLFVRRKRGVSPRTVFIFLTFYCRVPVSKKLRNRKLKENLFFIHFFFFVVFRPYKYRKWKYEKPQRRDVIVLSPKETTNYCIRKKNDSERSPTLVLRRSIIATRITRFEIKL